MYNFFNYFFFFIRLTRQHTLPFYFSRLAPPHSGRAAGRQKRGCCVPSVPQHKNHTNGIAASAEKAHKHPLQESDKSNPKCCATEYDTIRPGCNARQERLAISMKLVRFLLLLSLATPCAEASDDFECADDVAKTLPGSTLQCDEGRCSLSLRDMMPVDDISRALQSLKLCQRDRGYNVCETAARLSSERSPFAQFMAEKLAVERGCDIPRYDFCDNVDDILRMDDAAVRREASKCKKQCVLPKSGTIKADADCYITKPVKIKVLISKVKSLLRRVSDWKEGSKIIEAGSLIINREEYKIMYEGDEKILPRKEFELLTLLASKPNKVFEREVILDRVWGNEVIVGGRTIDVHIRKLREKIGNRHFKTVKGVGYKYVI